MGADLYILPLFDQQYKAWEPTAERAAASRDSASPGSHEWELCASLAEHCRDEMYKRGYFRDSYNPSNLLWKFGLSWWSDIIPLLDDDGYLSPVDARHLLAVLQNREPCFEAELAQLNQAEQHYFQNRYAELRAFLREAIRLDAPILASL
jgi:hypothetical protein